ncbi:MAG: DUF4240 domain-containing protein [Fimbriimonadales bacterium]
MDLVGFWEIIESSRGNANAISRQLQTLQPAEIEGWNRTFWELHSAAYRWDLWGAAYLILGGCSDDSFDYFRAWLIGKGRTAYEAALQNPESLVTVVTDEDIEEDCENESLMSVAEDAYEMVTGQHLHYTSSQPPDPIGEEWEEEDLPTRFPLLNARFD